MAGVLGRRILVRLGTWWLHLAYRGCPVPIGKLLPLRGFSRGPDVLSPDNRAVASTGNILCNNFLARRLAEAELGIWSLTASSLNFLERQIQLLRPHTVLEFGSGLSTVCLARYMLELHGDSSRVYMLSIEQDPAFVGETNHLLEVFQLKQHVNLIHCPLRRQIVEGQETTCYDLSSECVVGALRNARADFIVIDGPAAESGARFGTLPLVRSHVKPGARFFLDDALRDGELEVAQMWSQLPSLHIEGVYLIGKGLLVGQIQRTIG